MFKNFTLYKNKILAVSLIAIFAISLVMAFTPDASAQLQSGYGKNLTRSYTTAGYIGIAPTIIGVGQTATVNAWVYPLPENYAYGSWYFGPNGGSYTGITVTFIRPDGTKDTFMPTDGVGTYPAGVLDGLATMYFYYTPNMAGNWSVSFTMPRQNFTDPTGTVDYSACTSNSYYFTVTTEKQNAGLLNGWPYSPLPNVNAYWTYPISANNREWSAISGEWLSWNLFPVGGGSSGNYNPYATAVATGHVLWDTQAYMGGIIGGSFGSTSYQGYGQNVAANVKHVIMEGKLYINLASSNNQFECFDLTTGKLLYTATGVISAGIHLPGNAYAQALTSAARGSVTTETVLGSSYGASPTGFLFGTSSGSTNSRGYPTTNWLYYNPLTGQLQRTITNVTASQYDFVDGSELCWGTYYVNFSARTYIYDVNYIFELNLTKVVGNDWWTGVMWTHTLNNPATGLMGPFDGQGGRGTIALSTDLSTMVVGGSQGHPICDGFSATDGHSLWNVTLGYISMNDADNDFLYNTNYWMTVQEETNTIYCYSMFTGALVWKTVLPSSGNAVWTTKAHYKVDNDLKNYYVLSPDGSIIALDIATGNIAWTSIPIPSTEMAYNALPIWEGAVEGGGLLYSYCGYSLGYELNPIPRFAVLQAINVTTGATVWTLNGGILPEAIAGGYLTGFSPLNGMVYVLGKGQTSTSVTVQNDVVAEGATVLIKGNVLDQSPAQPGTPAVSDSSMSEQMDYLHMQNATLLNNPPKEQGVQVTLTAVDPNKNTISIGITTTGSDGNFAYSFNPSMTGIFTITANFAGSNSYWPSTSGTSLLVTAAPTFTSTSGQTTTSSGVSDTALYTVGAVLAIVIVIGFVASILLLRKRP